MTYVFSMGFAFIAAVFLSAGLAFVIEEKGWY
jgi:hypothetical protein